MKQEFCSRRKCMAGKLRSSEARIFGEHGRAQRRDDFENHLLIRLSHADREMAGAAARAESSFFVRIPRRALFRRGVRATRTAAHAITMIFRSRGGASYHGRRSRQKGDDQQYALKPCQHCSRVDGSRDLDAGRPVFIPGCRTFLSTW
jgi:hypothetical protein